MCATLVTATVTGQMNMSDVISDTIVLETTEKTWPNDVFDSFVEVHG